MTSENGKLSPNGISRRASSFGYRYTDLTSDSSVGDRESPQFEGRIGFQALPSGISLFTSDVVSLHDAEHRGVANRSLNMAFILEAGGADCSFGLERPVSMDRDMASIVSIPDSAPIAGRYQAGRRLRSVLLRTRPEDITDEALAEQVETVLRSTTVSQLPVTPGLLPLAQEIAMPSHDGVVGRLFAESCAQKLLACALLTLGSKGDADHPRLSRRDLAGLRRVRDMILANPASHFTLDEFAREAGMSMTVLKAKFSTAYGQSVFSFLRDARLHHAKDGLEKEGWTVSQAAHFVGYRHHSNFSTAFRRRYGVSPKRFRKA
ncbi:MAG: AraC family transcriptional regulator [Pseudomonadota bacterium]